MPSLSLLKLLALNWKMTDICTTPCFFPLATTGCHAHAHPTETFVTSCARKKRKEVLPPADDASKKLKQVEDNVVFYDASECLESDTLDQENLMQPVGLELDGCGSAAAPAVEQPGLLQTVISCITSQRSSSSQVLSSAAACVELSEVSSGAASSLDPAAVAVAADATPMITQVAPPAVAQRQHEDEYDDYDYFDPLLFMKNLPPLERCIAQNRRTLLPKQTRRCKQKTLVLDLDETLVHSSMEPISSPDFTFVVEFNNQLHSVHVKRRPNLDIFLQRAAELFEVVVFTASQKVYAEKLLNLMDPQRKLVRYRVYRESCVLVDGNYLKDLTVLGRDMAHTFIVDNSPQAFGFQVDNGIPIESWYEDAKDRELLNLLPFLESLADVDDVRPHIQQRFRLKEMITRS